MAKFDQLDEVLNNSTLTMEDFLALAEVLDEKNHMPMDNEERREFLNQKIRHAYGNVFPNMFRNWWEPDYVDIVRAVAKKMGVHYDKLKVEEIEEKILCDIIDLAKKEIIKEKGIQEWEKIMEQTEVGIQQAINEGKIKADEAAKLKSLSGAALFAALIGGKLAGFALFMVANQIFFAIARTLGLGIGVAVAGPIIGKTLAFLLGPAGWVLAGIAVIFSLGDTNWKKVIPAVVLVAVYRRKIKYGM